LRTSRLFGWKAPWLARAVFKGIRVLRVSSPALPAVAARPLFLRRNDHFRPASLPRQPAPPRFFSIRLGRSDAMPEPAKVVCRTNTTSSTSNTKIRGSINTNYLYIKTNNLELTPSSSCIWFVGQTNIEWKYCLHGSAPAMRRGCTASILGGDYWVRFARQQLILHDRRVWRVPPMMSQADVHR